MEWRVEYEEGVKRRRRASKESDGGSGRRRKEKIGQEKMQVISNREVLKTSTGAKIRNM